MNFLDIPEEVIYGHLLHFLDLNDILRFRRVCKISKSSADQYLRFGKFQQFHRTAGSEVEINEEDKLLLSLLESELKFPATHFYINNSSQAFFEDPAIPAFLIEYGHQITHLRVRKFYTLTSKPEMKFYEGFPNLMSLELEEIDASKRICNTTSRRQPLPFPQNFRNLKTLKLGLVHRSSPRDFGYAWNLIEFCEKLEYVSHPRLRVIEFEGDIAIYADGNGALPTHTDGDFGCIAGIITKRARDHPNESNLKLYDLKHYQVVGTDFSTDSFLQLLDKCNQFGVKLLNVDAQLFSDIAMRPDFETLPNPVVSLKNLHVANLLMESPSLEKIVIEGTSRCSFLQEFEDNPHPRWPALKRLDITIDSLFLAYVDTIKECTSYLLDYLFCCNAFRHRSRTNLVDLRLHFKRNDLLCPFPGAVCPKASSIIISFQNLKKLTITNWPGTNKALSILWSGLQLLEEISMGDFANLGNSAFVGEKTENPVLLSLKYLNKLTLKGLDKMPKVTDTVFRLVFRHLKLAHFYLESSAPIKHITVEGIRSLQNGEFANSIRKFPFQGWSLNGVCEEDFRKLACGFRSSRMV